MSQRCSIGDRRHRLGGNGRPKQCGGLASAHVVRAQADRVDRHGEQRSCDHDGPRSRARNRTRNRKRASARGRRTSPRGNHPGRAQHPARRKLWEERPSAVRELRIDEDELRRDRSEVVHKTYDVLARRLGSTQRIGAAKRLDSGSPLYLAKIGCQNSHTLGANGKRPTHSGCTGVMSWNHLCGIGDSFSYRCLHRRRLFRDSPYRGRNRFGAV